MRIEPDGNSVWWHDCSTKLPVEHIADIARTSHQSLRKDKEDDDEKLVRNLLSWGHMTPFEHVTATLIFKTDIKIAMALLRHRHISAIQESTRYCDYTNKKKFPNGLSVIFPESLAWIDEESYHVWVKAMEYAEKAYKKLVKAGIEPEHARTVLPMATKTETVVTANLREWRYIIETRITPGNHPEMIKLMQQVLSILHFNIPVVFDDLYERWLSNEEC